MKTTPVYNAQGDKILACHCDLAYYASIGWTVEKPAPKLRTTKAPVKPVEENT